MLAARLRRPPGGGFQSRRLEATASVSEGWSGRVCAGTICVTCPSPMLMCLGHVCASALRLPTMVRPFGGAAPFGGLHLRLRGRSVFAWAPGAQALVMGTCMNVWGGGNVRWTGWSDGVRRTGCDGVGRSGWGRSVGWRWVGRPKPNERGSGPRPEADGGGRWSDVVGCGRTWIVVGSVGVRPGRTRWVRSVGRAAQIVG